MEIDTSSMRLANEPSGRASKKGSTTCQLVGTVGANKQDRLPANFAPDESEQVKCRIICPVQILKNQQQRPVPGNVREEAVHNRKQFMVTVDGVEAIL